MNQPNPFSYTTLALVLFIVGCSPIAYAQKAKISKTGDWLQFRGPNGTGVAEGSTLPAEFGPNKNLVWKTPLPFARSSPVVTEDRVFITATEGAKLSTFALDRKTGRIVWRRDIVRARQMQMYKANDGASPSPVSDGKNVFAFFSELGLIAYGPGGNELWRIPLGPFNSFYGMAASPVLAGNTLVMVCDHRTNSFIVAVDSRTGKVLWNKPRPHFEAYSTPSVYKPKDGPTQILVTGSGPSSLDAYSVDKGERLWWVAKMGNYPKGVPVLGNDMVYVHFDGGEVPFLAPFDETLKSDKDNDKRLHSDELKVAYFAWLDGNGDGYVDRTEWNFVRDSLVGGYGVTAVRLGAQGVAGDLTTTNVAWNLRKSYPSIPSPLIYRGVLYLMKEGGILSTLDPTSGTVLKMGRTPNALEPYYASPVAADGKVFLVSASGKVTVLKAGAQWEIIATNDLDEECWATPAIAGNNIYIRTRDALYSFGESSK